MAELHSPTMQERLAEFARAVAWSGRVIEVPAVDLPEDERMPLRFEHHLVYDTQRIRAELGYQEVVNPSDALRRITERERVG